MYCLLLLEAAGKSAAEATARDAFAGVGCVSGYGVIFSDDGGSDDDGFDDGDCVEGGMLPPYFWPEISPWVVIHI